MYQINPAELERVYAPAPSSVSLDMPRDTQSDAADTAGLIAAKDREIALLREMADKADAIVVDLRAERDRLLTMVEMATATVRQLTHERPAVMPDEATPQAPAAGQPILPWARAWVRMRLARL